MPGTWGKTKRENVIGSIQDNKLVCASVFNENINTQVFEDWFLGDFFPLLPPRSVVVLDNVSFHKSPKIAKAMREEGHLLKFLPPYSPDFNPIEHKWAEAKNLRRSHQLSTVDALNAMSWC